MLCLQPLEERTVPTGSPLDPNLGGSTVGATLTVPGLQAVAEGQVVDVSVAAVGLTAPVYTAVGLPPGLSMDPATGEITGTLSSIAGGVVTRAGFGSALIVGTEIVTEAFASTALNALANSLTGGKSANGFWETARNAGMVGVGRVASGVYAKWVGITPKAPATLKGLAGQFASATLSLSAYFTLLEADDTKSDPTVAGFGKAVLVDTPDGRELAGREQLAQPLKDRIVKTTLDAVTAVYPTEIASLNKLAADLKADVEKAQSDPVSADQAVALLKRTEDFGAQELVLWKKAAADKTITEKDLAAVLATYQQTIAGIELHLATLGLDVPIRQAGRAFVTAGPGVVAYDSTQLALIKEMYSAAGSSLKEGEFDPGTGTKVAGYVGTDASGRTTYFFSTRSLRTVGVSASGHGMAPDPLADIPQIGNMMTEAEIREAARKVVPGSADFWLDSVSVTVHGVESTK